MLSKETGDQQSQDYYLAKMNAKLNNGPNIDRHILKEMLTTASIVDLKERDEFSCTYCKYPVLDARYCLVCGDLVCSICLHDKMVEGDPLVCPDKDCKADSYETEEVLKKVMKKLNSIQLCCTKEGCPNKGESLKYDDYLAQHPEAHFENPRCAFHCGQEV